MLRSRIRGRLGPPSLVVIVVLASALVALAMFVAGAMWRAHVTSGGI